MSVEAVDWALRGGPNHGAIPLTRDAFGVERVGMAAVRLVLFVLAEHANADRESYPSQQSIATETGTDRRTVRKCLAVLVAAGLVEQTAPAIPRVRGATYRLRMPTRAGGVSIVSDRLGRGECPESTGNSTGNSGVHSGVHSGGESAHEPNRTEPSPLPPNEIIDRVLDAAAGRVIETREQNGFGAGGPGALTKARAQLDRALAEQWLADGCTELAIATSLASRLTDGGYSTPPNPTAPTAAQPFEKISIERVRELTGRSITSNTPAVEDAL